MPIPVAATPFVVDATLSLAANVSRLVSASLHRSLQLAEVDAVDDALVTASGVLQAGDATTRRALLQSNVLAALANPGAALVWAACVEKSEGGIDTVDAFANAVIESCSDIASVLFAAAAGAYEM